MMPDALFSAPQIAGYVVLVLGVSGFLQKSDARLKAFVACGSVAYVVHFILLGNYPASGSAAVSSLRTFSSIRYRSLWLMSLFLAANLAVGALLAKGVSGWIPVAGSCVATVAVFRLHGIVFRLALLACTLLWLTNDILCGSVGGTLLEAVVGVVNLSTIARMVAARRSLGVVLPVPPQPLASFALPAAEP